MARFKILPYKLGSAGAKLLAQHLERLVGRKVWRIRSPQRIRPTNKVINWGYHDPAPPDIINRVICTNLARDKRLSFSAFATAHAPTVEWSTDPAKAKEWLDAGKVVYERHTATGHAGIGIRLLSQPTDVIQPAPLYSKYFPAKGEYRIHVMKGEVIDYARKRKKHGVQGNKYIRSHDNGYVFSRVDVRVPECVSTAAIQAIESLGLDFGAVDVLHNELKNTAAVLEINSAPGLDNHTAEKYAQAFVRNYGL